MDHIGIIGGLPMDKVSLITNLGFIQPMPPEGLLAVVFLFWQRSYPPPGAEIAGLWAISTQVSLVHAPPRSCVRIWPKRLSVRFNSNAVRRLEEVVIQYDRQFIKEKGTPGLRSFTGGSTVLVKLSMLVLPRFPP